MVHTPARVAVAVMTIATLACNDAHQDLIGTADCKTQVQKIDTSPAVGVVTLPGQFYPDETVMIQSISNGQRVTVAQATPATARTSLTFTGMPSGDRYYNIVVSCAAGQHDLGQYQLTVQ